MFYPTFPVWFEWLWPPSIALALPAMLLADLLVLALTLVAMHAEQAWKKAYHVIWRVWICGFFAHFAGAIMLLVWNTTLRAEKPEGDMPYFEMAVWRMLRSGEMDAFDNALSFVLVTLAVFLSGVLVYLFNKTFSLGRLDASYEQKRGCALVLAIATAPYYFYLSTGWFA